MKYFTLPLLCSLVALGQSVIPATTQPAAKAPVAPETVVLKVGAKSITAAEFERMIANYPPDLQQAARTNPKQFFQAYYVMETLTRQAEQEKLDQTSPVKEQLELQRMQTLATAVVNRQQAGIAVSDEEVQKRYDADKDKKYAQAKVRGILVAFADPKALHAQVDMSNPSAPKASVPMGLRSEAEAKTIAEELATGLRSGADFAAVAKERSEDKQSAGKGGDLGMLRQTDRMPEDIKRTVFALRSGQVSDPIRQQNGFYIIKVEDRSIVPFAEAKTPIVNEIRQERFQQWMTGVQKPFEVSVENPAFFGAAPLPMPQTSVEQHPAQATPRAK